MTLAPALFLALFLMLFLMLFLIDDSVRPEL
jgi:hypothetical protein